MEKLEHLDEDLLAEYRLSHSQFLERIETVRLNEKYIVCNLEPNQICDLPDVVFLKIIEYLWVEDIVNLRLACKRLYNLINYPGFFKRVSIRMSKIDSCDMKIFQNLLQNFRSNLSLNLTDLPGANFKSMLPYFTCVEDIFIRGSHLRDICEHCENIRNMVIYLDKLDDIMDSESNEKSNEMEYCVQMSPPIKFDGKHYDKLDVRSNRKVMKSYPEEFRRRRILQWGRRYVCLADKAVEQMDFAPLSKLLKLDVLIVKVVGLTESKLSKLSEIRNSVKKTTNLRFCT